MNISRNRFLLHIAIACFSISLAFGQNAISNPHSAVTNSLVRDFQVKDNAIIDAVAELSFSRDVDLHIGFEEIIREKMADPRDRAIRFSLHLEGKTVSQILDTLCQYDGRYTWSMDGDTLNVFPRTTMGDSSYLMNLTIDDIGFRDIPDPDQALTPLWKKIPQQQIGYMQAGGDNTYDAPWSSSFRILTVRQFINRVAEHMGSRTSWVWQGGKQERMFTFLKGGFHTELTQTTKE